MEATFEPVRRGGLVLQRLLSRPGTQDGRRWTRTALTPFFRLYVTPKAPCGMIVDHANRLHPGVGDGRPDKLEAAPLQFLRNHLGEGAARNPAFSVTQDRLASRKRPAEFREVLATILHLPVDLCALDCGFDFCPCAHDARVRHQPLDLHRIGIPRRPLERPRACAGQ